MAISLWDMLSAELTDLCFSMSKLGAEEETSTLYAGASISRCLNKMAWAVVVMSFTVCCSCDYFISVRCTGDSCWQCEASGRRKSHHFQQRRRVLPLNLSSSSHQRMNLRDKVFLTVWGMGISDSISLGPPQAMHFVEVKCKINAKIYINGSVSDWLVSKRLSTLLQCSQKGLKNKADVILRFLNLNKF